MKKFNNCIKRILALLIVIGLVAGFVPASVLENFGAVVASAAEISDSLELDNGYLKVTVSEKTGGFGIRTVEGDKVNKSDNDKYLVFEYDEDNTSFTSFQVARNGAAKEYIFGGKYPGSSDVSVSRKDDALVAVWSVDDLTFTQTITLVNTGSTEHGTALISYAVENAGTPADVKCRILMDTALGYQDYAYYRVDKDYLERETALGEDGYEKSFYAVTNPNNPGMTAYTINASVDDRECKPYRTVFAHWNNLASSVFDYEPDGTMTFTNFNNRKYLTSDSAFALYFDMGAVASGSGATVATNYGVYSNESMDLQDTMAVNVNAPDVIQYAKKTDGGEDQSAYENGGKFTVKTHIKNISSRTYTDIRIVVTTAGCIQALDQMGNPVETSFENPYSMVVTDVTAGEQLDIEWNFQATPQESGQYSRILYKVYDVSDGATLGSGQIMQENLLGEGSSFILCPGSVTKVPQLKFTGSSPSTIFSSGIRNFYVTGDNFAMLLDKSAYELRVSRVDGAKINGIDSFVIPAEQFQIDDSTNVISVILNDENPGNLPEGRYQLTIDYADTAKEDISGSALQFQVSNEEKYRNDTYGFLAVIKSKDGNGDFTYSIEHFLDEEAYWSYLDAGSLAREDVLLEFAGLFSEQKTEDGTISYKGISNNDSHNVMTMNGALDIRDGTCTVTEDNGSVKVDFDAEIYTTGSNTYVHTGVAALTELERGKDYDLIVYSENGNRKPTNGKPIALLWPSVGQAFQNIMGMLFNLRYGELGVIGHENAPSAQGSQTRLVAFGAAMDLSFLIPTNTDRQIILGKTSKTKDILGSSYDAAEHNSIQFSADEVRALNRRASYDRDTANTNATTNDVDMGRFSDMTVDATPGYNAASIVVDDILFGGEYLGVNMELALGIPPYIMNMPALECILSIRTVGDWSFGVEGQCHFASFKMQASLKIMSKDGVPIVDSMRFFIGGFTPGFNIDGVGVLWLQGAGGGIENIYNTIFMADTIPPLKLIVQAQFSVMQLFNAVATMGLSLQGIDITLTNGQFTAHTNEETGVITQPQPVTMDAGLQLDWYPEFYFLGYVNMMLAMCINGGGYVVADADGFYEFFLRAGVQVPSNIPIIGGYEVAGMNMGVGTSKVWGKIHWMDLVTIALTYYWGGDIDWGSGAGVYPTYPELVGMDADSAMLTIPMDFDEETGRTLFMTLGDNVRLSAASIGVDAQNTARNIGDTVESDVTNGSMHTMQLTKNGSGKILSIQWISDSEGQARAEAASVIIASSVNSATQIPVKLWSKDSSEGANANFSYDPETRTAYLSVVFAANDETVFGTKWNIHTPPAAQLVVFDVAPMPEVEASAQTANNRITLNLAETQNGCFTDVTVVAEGKNGGQTYLLGGAKNPFAAGKATLTLTMPEQAISDTYILRIVCKDDDQQYYHEENIEISYTNPNQPDAPTAVSAQNAGDYKVAVTASASGEFDGYRFTAYDAKGNVVTGMSGILLNKDGSFVSYDENGRMQAPESANAADSYIIGGHFEQTVKNAKGEDELLVTGLSAGTYTIEVRTWKKVSNGTAALVSAPVTTTITVREPVATQLRVTAASVNGGTTLTETVTTAGQDFTVTSVADSDVLLQLSCATETFSGKWRVDGGFREDLRGEIAEGSSRVNLTVTGLSEGQHMFYFQGVNQYGDAVSVSFQFAVDTLGPRMLLSEPVNGGLFDYWTGELNISGITDRDVTMTVTDHTTGETVLEKAPLQVDETGHFDRSVTLDRTILVHDLTITLTDKLGNESSQDVRVMSNGLGSIEKLMIYSSDKDVTNTKLTAGGSYALRLMAQLKKPANAPASQNADDALIVLINTDGLVDWVQEVAEGESELEITKDGILLATASDAEGMITARFLVSDAGSWSVSAAFGYTGEDIQSLDSVYTQIVTTDRLYTGTERTTEIQVWYRGIQLVEGTDYTIGEYSNNVEVSTDTSKAQVQIHGMGTFSGTVTGEFTISYLELDESWINLSGVEGNDGYYVSDVSLIPAEGYEFVVDGASTQILLTADGENTVTFQVRRLSDGAMTDLVSRTVSIDKTAPTGTITLDETGWSKFLEAITFGLYKVNNLAAEITAGDNIAVDRIEYVITDTPYASVTDLAAAQLTWQTYARNSKPTMKENENQIIYARITDTAGNVTYLSTDGIHVDTIAPQVSIAVTGITANSVTFTITSSEAGRYFYTVRKATEEAPTAEQLKNCTGGVISPDKAGMPIELTVDNLSRNTVYIIYAVAEDSVVILSTGEAAPNTGSIAISDPITTDRVDLNESNTVVTVEDALYTGSQVKPSVSVVYDGVELVEGVDYEVTYLDNVDASEDKPSVRITGIGEYVGVLTESFAIRYLELDPDRIITTGTQGENGYYVSDVSITAAEGYELVEDGQAVQYTMNEDGTHTRTFRVRRLSDGAMTDLVTETVSIDKTAPTGSVTVDTSIWRELINAITFGLFFNETQEAAIAAEDACSGIASVEYVISRQALSLAQLQEQTWSAYTRPVTMDAEGNYVVYAKLTDKAGNISYISTDGLVIDTSAPTVTGIADGGSYYGDVTFHVQDEALDAVNVDGKAVELTDGGYTIGADNAQHTILVRDKAGNEIQYTITVYKTYTVTYVADGEIISTQTVGYGKDAQVPAVPPKDGYTGSWDHDGRNITEATTITAVYTKMDPEKIYHTVTYVIGGEIISTQTVEHGKDAAAPTVPAKDGYIGAWDHDGRNITADTTITAVYTIMKYTVTYVANGKVISTQIVEHGKDAVAPAVPAKDGYTGKWDHDGKSITEDTSIAAVYTSIPNPEVPATGDPSQLLLWILLTLLSLCVIVVLLLSRKGFFYKK